MAMLEDLNEEKEEYEYQKPKKEKKMEESKMDNFAELMAIMKNNGGDSDSGFGGGNGIMWLVLILLFMGRGNGLFGGDQQGAAVEGQIEAAINKANANQASNDLIMQGINGNRAAIGELATMFNCDFNKLESTLCDVKAMTSTIAQEINCSTDKVLGAVATGNQYIVNAIQAGNCDLKTMMSTCCCSIEGKIGDLKTYLSDQMWNDRLNQQKDMAGLTTLITSNFCDTKAMIAETNSNVTNEANLTRQLIIQTDCQNRIERKDEEISRYKQNEILRAIRDGGGCC